MISLTLLRLTDAPETPPQEVCLLKFIAYHLLLGLVDCYMQPWAYTERYRCTERYRDAQRPDSKTDVNRENF